MAIIDAYLYNYDNNSGYQTTPLRLSSMNTAVVPSFVPRISSSSDETDLDGTLHHTFPVDHGFSKVMSDDNKNYRVYGNYNPVDGNLYPSLTESNTTGSAPTLASTNTYWSAKVTGHPWSFVAYRENNLNMIYQVASDGSVTALSLPSSLSSEPDPINSLVIIDRFLFVAGDNVAGAMNTYRYNIHTATWTDMGAHNFAKLLVLRGTLYGINDGSGVYLISGWDQATFSSVTFLKTIGPNYHGADYPDAFVPFNGAGWLGKPSGLYRWDGVDWVQIFNLSVLKLTEYQGALYWVTNGWLYRFTGSLVERLQYFGSAENIVDLQAHENSLYILTGINTSLYKYGGSSAEGGDYRIFEHDGLNFRVIQTINTDAAIDQLVSIGQKLLLCYRATSLSVGRIAYLDFSKRYQATTSSLQKCYVMTADFDGDLPNINKVLRRVGVDVSDISSGDLITLSYQYHNGRQWSSWTTLPDLTYTNVAVDGVNYFELPATTSLEENIFRVLRLKLILTPAVGSSVSLKHFSVYYTVHPRHRLQFTLSVPITNPSSTESVTTSDGTVASDYPPNFTYSRIERFHYVHGSMFFIAPQSAKLQDAILASDTSFYVKGALPVPSSSQEFLPLIALYDDGNFEIIKVGTSQYDTVNDLTYFSSLKRGCFATPAVAKPADTEVRIAYQVTFDGIMRDPLMFDDQMAYVETNGSRQFQHDLTIRLTEV